MTTNDDRPYTHAELVEMVMAGSGCDRETAELAIDRLSTALPCDECGADHPVSFHDVNTGGGK